MNEFLGKRPEFPKDLSEDLNLVIARKKQTVLLGRKTRGFGKGKLVLPGGKNQYYLSEEGMGMVPGQVGAARELGQETGIHLMPEALLPVGVLFVSSDESREVKVYSATVSEAATAQNSDELQELEWYSDSALPYGEMPGEYRVWLPHIMAGYAITAFFNTDEDDVLIDANIFRHKIEPASRIEHIAVEIPSRDNF